MKKVTNKMIDAVLETIKKDFQEGDVSSLWVLISSIPYDRLLAYLPEDEWPEFD